MIHPNLKTKIKEFRQQYLDLSEIANSISDDELGSCWMELLDLLFEIEKEFGLSAVEKARKFYSLDSMFDNRPIRLV